VHASVNFGEEQEPIAALLRPCNKGNQYASVTLLRMIIERLKKAFPLAVIEVRADSGFSCPEIYDMLEGEHCDTTSRSPRTHDCWICSGPNGAGAARLPAAAAED